MNGEAPLEVTSVVDETPGIEVDQHSITVCRYRARAVEVRDALGHASPIRGRSSRSRNAASCWSAADGTISSYDYDDHVTLQTRRAPAPTQVPVDTLPPGRRAPIEYMLARIDDGAPITGPLDPALCLVGQRIVDSAVLSAATKRTVALVA